MQEQLCYQHRHATECTFAEAASDTDPRVGGRVERCDLVVSADQRVCMIQFLAFSPRGCAGGRWDAVWPQLSCSNYFCPHLYIKGSKAIDV